MVWLAATGGAWAWGDDAARSSAAGGGVGAGTTGIDYNRDIRPILSENCYACHGPDTAKRKGGLRLDQKESAFSELSSGGRAIVPGKVGESSLVERITSRDADELMPPPETGKTLKPEQIDLIRRWIESGARWKGFWSFVPPVRPSLPEVDEPEWGRNPIDRFVLARLAKAGLKHNPPADKAALIRRVTFDLTGLPPTPAEVDAFLTDASPDAYERVVDRLLTSPRYGERMAIKWLDLARYADSNGYHIDNGREMWLWRQWVIEAFNRNLPYDQFVVEQLAGDMLPNATVEQKIASGFNRNTMVNFEGGADEREYLAKYIVDRVNTTSTVFLGLTMGCAECHDHKYDPISTKEFYQFYAFFHGVPEKGLDGSKSNPVPSLAVASPAQEKQLAELSDRMATLDAKMKGPLPDVDQAQAEWEKTTLEEIRAAGREQPAAPAWAVLDLTSARSRNGAVLTRQADGSVLVSGTNPDTDVYEVEAVLAASAGKITGIRLEALTDPSLPGGGVGRYANSNFVLTALEAEAAPTNAPDDPAKVRAITFVAAAADYSQEGWPVQAVIDPDPRTGWAVFSPQMQTPHTAVFVLSAPVGFEAGLRLKLRLKFESVHAQHAIGRFRLAVTSDQAPLSGLAREGASAVLSGWRSVGPFTAPDGREAFAEAFEPEKDVLKAKDKPLDAARAYGDARLKWTSHPEWKDGQVYELDGAPNAATYLYRTIEAKGGPLTIRLGSDDGVKLWLNGKAVLSSNAARGVAPDQETVKVDLKPGGNALLMKISNLAGGAGFYFLADGAAVRPAEIDAALTAAPESRTTAQTGALQRYYRDSASPEVQAMRDDLAGVKKERDALAAQVPQTMVMAEMDKPRDTFVLVRGDFLHKGEKVSPGVPSALGALPAGEPVNRLTLARWLVAPDHPLTARVAVNHYWQMYFGLGLVKTAGDFGAQGEWPSHPDLLDWLAREFIDGGWDVKAMQRLIVTSQTYRQSARATVESVQQDPENRLLARGPRFRLTAEMIRDNALSVSGLLNGAIGGPSIFPYQPPGLWEEVAFGGDFSMQKYVQSHGRDLYRRGLYIYGKRSMPNPSLVAFDAPSREVCAVARPVTNTPLQALLLLNDTVYVEAARVMAERVMRESGSNCDARIAFAFRLCTARAPTERETAVLRGVYQKALAKYKTDPAAAEKLLSVGEAPRAPGIDPAEHAAWTAVCNVLLNLDETITRG